MKSAILHRLSRLRKQARGALKKDRYMLKKRISRLEKEHKGNPEKDIEKKLVRVENAVCASVESRKARRENIPVPEIQQDLPIFEKTDVIIKAIRENPVVIISGETGSGKTTQIPKLALLAGRGREGKIGVTQPRRIAAVTVSERIAREMDTEIGSLVGYKIRFRDKTSDAAYIQIMTDGILLTEAQIDPCLNAYDTLIIDEAHERSLNIDFILGILKTLIPGRRDLRVIITSATIDTEKFSKAFDNAPVIGVSGRMFPVEMQYIPPEETETDDSYVEAAAATIERIHRESPYGGDILVFMPTERDIMETIGLVEGRRLTGVVTMPLFARLSARDQSKVFQSVTGRKVIVATNVAETSITIPNIQFVVDTGLARISQYSPRTRTTSLPVSPVSRSSADQRAGRAGRVRKGVCIRLFSEEDYHNRPRFTPPEILRSNLAEVILRMISLHLPDISAFPFIDPPGVKHIQDGIALLFELEAIEAKGNKTGPPGKGGKESSDDPPGPAKPVYPRLEKNGSQNPPARYGLTALGKIMAKIPIDPRLSRMLLHAKDEGCLVPVMVIASVLSIQDPRERPAEKSETADRAHREYLYPKSDFVTLLRIWDDFFSAKKQLSSWNQVRKYCKTQFISYRRMREWKDIYEQISAILEEHGIRPANGEKEIFSNIPKKGEDTAMDKSLYAGIHRSVLSGFLSGIAHKKEAKLFIGAKGKEMMIFPGSAVFQNPGEWIVAAEIVETTRRFARTVGEIDPSWLEPLAGALVTRTCSNPRWMKKRGEVMADEQVSLFGLLIVSGRPVSYGRIDPDTSQNLFLHALASGDIQGNFRFLKHNLALMERVGEMEERLRRRDILISEEEVVRFYREKLPGIRDTRSLRSYIKRKGGDGFLFLSEEDVCIQMPREEDLSMFPKQIRLGDETFSCLYCFDPGKEEDGITVRISGPEAALAAPDAIDWLVPGLFEEKITALIKGLPKTCRKQLVPVSETAKAVSDKMKNRDGNLYTELSRCIHEMYSIDIPASAWNPGALPEHLLMRISLTDRHGREIASGRDKSLLLKAGAAAAETPAKPALSDLKATWEKTNLKKWDFGDLPETVTTRQGKKEITAYPALVPEDEGVSLRITEDLARARRLHPKGVKELFTIHLSGEIKYMKKAVRLSPQAASRAVDLGGAKHIETKIIQTLICELCEKPLRKHAEFEEAVAEVRKRLLSFAKEKKEAVEGVLDARYEALQTLSRLFREAFANKKVQQFLTILETELNKLVPENFVSLYSTQRLFHMKRYIRAVSIRAERGTENLEKEMAKEEELAPHMENLNTLLSSLSPEISCEKKESILDFFWMVEEFKVSLFAQELKTAVPVSGKRLMKKFAEIRRMV